MTKEMKVKGFHFMYDELWMWACSELECARQFTLYCQKAECKFKKTGVKRGGVGRIEENAGKQDGSGESEEKTKEFRGGQIIGKREEIQPSTLSFQ